MTFQRRIWEFLLKAGPCTAQEIARCTGISRGRVAGALERLREVHAIVREGWSEQARYSAVADATPCRQEARNRHLTDAGRLRGSQVSALRSRERAAKRNEPRPIVHPRVKQTHALDIAWGLRSFLRDDES